MTPDMSVDAMLDSFIFIVKGSRIIDRRATDWSRYVWLDEKYVKHHVHTVAELKRYFTHRVIKSKWWMDRRDPFGAWLTHPDRFTAPTLTDAMNFADRAARGLVEPRIDIEAIIRKAEARTRLRGQPTQPPWLRSRTAA